MIKILLITLLSVNLSANLLYAHPGDHGPTLFEPQNNGITQSLETIHLELVENKNNLKLYVYDLKGNSIDTKPYPIKTRILLPLKKTAPIEFVSKGKYWEGTYIAPKNIHRYTLELTIEQGGHKDIITFTIDQENKK